VKKFVFLVVIGVALFYKPLIGYGNGSQIQGENYQVIPDDSIRLRILANSNSDADQAIKREIRDEVNAQITEWVLELEDINTARDVIQNQLVNLEAIVQNVLDNHNVDQSFTIEFGDVQFPSKVYGNYVYPAGTYEAVLITLGDGEGENWWCVLFPPLCFLDFSNGTSVAAEETTDTEATTENPAQEKAEVKFFLIEWIEKLLSLFK
jgi:stage II sporulation protein R